MNTARGEIDGPSFPPLTQTSLLLASMLHDIEVSYKYILGKFEVQCRLLQRDAGVRVGIKGSQ